MVDDDIQTAFVTAWVADTGAGHLQVLIPGGPKAGKIPAPLVVPYCHVEVKEDRETEWASGGVGWFARKITLCVYDYHKRSNIESTFSAIKRKFGDSVRSRTDTAMVNEVLCKFLANNICVELFHPIWHKAGSG